MTKGKRAEQAEQEVAEAEAQAAPTETPEVPEAPKTPEVPAREWETRLWAGTPLYVCPNCQFDTFDAAAIAVHVRKHHPKSPRA